MMVSSASAPARSRAGSSRSSLEAMCAIRQLRSGTACLWCNGLIDGTQLALEAKTDEERKAQDYGVGEANPSVTTLNAVAAGHAVNDFLFDFPDLRTESGDAVYQHHHFLRNTVQSVIPRKVPNGRGQPRQWWRSTSPFHSALSAAPPARCGCRRERARQSPGRRRSAGGLGGGPRRRST